MAPQHTDYILRIIEQLGAALRRIRSLLARGTAGAEAALEESRLAQAELLGDRSGMLERLDPETAATLMSDPRQLQLWIDLIRAEEESLRLLERRQEADALAARARRLEEAMRSSSHSR